MNANLPSIIRNRNDYITGPQSRPEQ